MAKYSRKARREEARRRRQLEGPARTTSDRCGKLRYSDAATATAAAELRALHPSYPDNLRAYPCPLCDGYHITSEPKRRA